MLTKGLTFAIFDGDEFVVIPGINTFSPGAESWATQETTPIHTTELGRTYAKTLLEVGDFTFTMLADGGDEQAEVIAAHASQSSVQFQMTVPNYTLGSFTIEGLVTNCKPVTDVDGLFAYEVGIKVSGVVADELATLLSVEFTDEHEGSYETGDTIQLTATYDEYVKVTGSPRIGIVLDSGTVYAVYDSGTGTNQLVFEYEVQGGDQAEATEFEVVSPIGLNGGTIKDLAAQNADLTFDLPDTASFEVNPA